MCGREAGIGAGLMLFMSGSSPQPRRCDMAVVSHPRRRGDEPDMSPPPVTQPDRTVAG